LICWDSDVQAGCGAAEVQLIGHRDEVAQLSQLHALIVVA
jgi:hypothetical protein